ncbi:MAG: hypothetical protein JW741_19780 [Sedimentisphaerales bacterium]|nr:hypothetical protein [Sedimentisphaerales bacterium]
MTDTSPGPLLPWMRWLLRFAGVFNLLAGIGMIGLYHEGYKLFGIPKPAVVLPIQVMGVLVGLFGVGYLLVSWRPLENRNLLVLGFWSKAISAGIALAHVAAGHLPWTFGVAVFLSDVIYLPPFWIIIQRLRKVATG